MYIVDHGLNSVYCNQQLQESHVEMVADLLPWSIVMHLLNKNPLLWRARTVTLLGMSVSFSLPGR